MPVYQYTARGGTGAMERDTIEAGNKDQAIQMLIAKGVTPLTIEAPETGLNTNISVPFLDKKPSVMDVALFTRQLAKLLERGVPIMRSLDTLQRQATNKVFKGIITQILKDVATGSTLVEAISRHPKTFNEIYIGLAAAGEEAGSIDKSLNNLSDILMKEVELNRKIRGAMTYPAVVMVAAALITYFLMTSIVPQFANMLQDVGGQLPPLTIAVIFISDILRKSPLIIVALIAGTVFGLRWYDKTPAGHLTLDGLKLKLPVFGNLIKKSAMARISRSMGTMLRSGMNVLSMLKLARNVAGNEVIARAVDTIREDITKGVSIGDAFMAQEPLFPPIMTSMIQTGDETGKFDDLLLDIADYYDLEVDEITSSLASLIEPIMTIFLGGIVGIIVAALLLPYFNIISTLGG